MVMKITVFLSTATRESTSARFKVNIFADMITKQFNVLSPKKYRGELFPSRIWITVGLSNKL